MTKRFVALLVIIAVAVVAGAIFAWRAAAPSASPQAPSPSVASATSTPASSPSVGQVPSPNPAPPSAPAPAAASPSGPPLVETRPGRPGAQPVPEPPTPIPNAPEPLAIPADFLDRIVSGNGVQFELPGGGLASGSVELIERDAHGITTVQGRLSSPQPGFYFFHRQSEPGVAGAFFGNVRFDDGIVAYRLEPSGPGGSTQLVPRRIDEVLCVGLPEPPEEPASAAGPNAEAELGDTPLNAPQTHPTDIPIPPSQNGIIPLQSLPGAAAVVFLDFEGGPGPWPGWGNFPVAPANVNNNQIKDIWQRVSEDFQPFNINVTTDRSVFEAAARSSRQRVMITPTNTASPGNGGVAFGGSFNSTADNVCWAFYTTGKNAAEVISHEVGHTLRLAHDGRAVPGQQREEYYGGHGSGDTGWAPIMGVGYYQVLSQWSKGEYAYATQTQDDLQILTNNNNSVNYRADDYGGTHATAGYLEIQANNSVSNEGIIERNTDVDAFRFETTGGQVSFTVSRVALGPNLDIEASIYNSSNQLVGNRVNPADSLNATVTATLEPGEYTLRVTGVGKGDPTTGYTNYGSLGAYLITGVMAGGVKPYRFTIAENAPNGTAVGTVSPRKNHGGNPLTYTITSGNTGGAFTIDPQTGQITVANSSRLNYESLSTRWDVPATIPLFVSISDASDPSLNETIRVVVTVSDVNEAPVVQAASGTIFSRTRAGTEVLKMSGTDPDHFDFVSWFISGGNTGNIFAVDSVTGVITIANPPDVSTPTTYQLVVRARDQLTPTRYTDTVVPITVLPLGGTYQPGAIVRTFYEGISGNAVSALTGSPKFPNNPDSQVLHTSFDGDAEHGENFGSTMTGYLIPPTTGNYTFWIASDDSSELRISTDSNPANATVRASVSGSTDPYQYNRFSSQQSAAIPLVRGQVYYIEARHKEGIGGDHLTVAWQGPGFSREVIPGRYLAPYSTNYPPVIPAATMQVRANAINGSTVGSVQVTDVNPEDTHSGFAILAGTGSSVFGIDSSTGRIFVKDSSALSAGSSYTLLVRAADNGSPLRTGTGTITIQATDSQTIRVNGIVRQIWRNFTGGNVAALLNHPGYPNHPDETRTLTSFDGGSLGFTQYGSRIRAYVVPPTTGNYRFYISSDDQSQLFLSGSSNPTTAVQIASVTNWVDPRSWTAQTGQASTVRTLVAGQRYYIEVRHRQGTGGDDLAVAWTTPSNGTPTVIPGSALEPFNINAAPTWNGTAPTFRIAAGSAAGTTVGSISAADPEGRTITYAITSGNADNAFAMDPRTGAITVASAPAVASPRTFSLTVAAQDEGLDGVYPLGTVNRTVAIEVLGAFDQWRLEKFGSDYSNAAISGDHADPDGDGLDNLSEYALGLEPRKADRGGIAFDTTMVGGKSHLRLTVTRNPQATDVALTIESTGTPRNASSWDASTTTVEIDTPEMLRVRDNTPMDAADARFLRLKATRK